MEGRFCQLRCIREISQKPNVLIFIFQRIKKARHAIKKRKNYFMKMIKSKNLKSQPVILTKQLSSDGKFKPDDMVRIRSKDEIKVTLDGWNQLKGCAFMEEMEQYCGTTQKIFKRVNRFLDERDYLIKKCKGIYQLHGIICEGMRDFGECDRSCFFFWREEWLEKVE